MRRQQLTLPSKVIISMSSSRVSVRAGPSVEAHAVAKDVFFLDCAEVRGSRVTVRGGGADTQRCGQLNRIRSCAHAGKKRKEKSDHGGNHNHPPLVQSKQTPQLMRPKGRFFQENCDRHTKRSNYRMMRYTAALALCMNSEIIKKIN